MDYEKAYKEALERAKKWEKKYILTNTVSPDGTMAKEFKEIFPQLAKNENEKIREELIDFIQWAEDRGMTRHDYHQAKRPAVWIAYLEKQKDISKAIEAVERIDRYIDEHVANAHDMKDSNPDKKYYRGWDDALAEMSGILQDVYSGKKQKEQKVDIDKLRRDIYQSGYNDGYQHGKEDAQKEQKPAEWSKEDKEMLLSIINAFRNGTVSTIGQEQWLKSLPKRFNLQPKQEWSKEDESQLDDIEKAISNYYDLNHAPQYQYWLEQKLKSIRPQPKVELTLLDKNIIEAAVAFVEQNDHFNVLRGIDKHTVIKALRSLKPHWKPSEEQMEALKKTTQLANFGSDAKRRDALLSLYEQLKKLM